MDKNRIILITYADSLGNNIQDLHRNLNTYFRKAVGGVHILPFFPSSGDHGFAPTTYTEVDAQFGDWKDVEELSADYLLMADYMINHISAKSRYFMDFIQKGDASPYNDLFIDFDHIWGKTPTSAQIAKIYKRKPKAPYRQVTLQDGSSRNVWCTFSDEQIDLNLETETGKEFLKENLIRLASHGVRIMRLDAFAYAIKKADTSCFFIEPEIWQLLEMCRQIVLPYGATIMPEVHEHYSMQLKIAQKGYAVYDFALPMLLLHAIYFGQAANLYHWFSICPRNQYTTLDTHDGIGVVDVYGLLSDEEIEATKNHLFSYGANVKRVYNTEAYNNLDIYQINCTYYSALGNDDQSYLLARAVQFFAPGTPQVYYVGMLAGKNDLRLLEETKEGRNINRHAYSNEEVADQVHCPVVQKLISLMELRNEHPAFDGEFSQEIISPSQLKLMWKNGNDCISLTADFKNLTYEIEY
ncbi:MAG: sucrose phosphorylase [Spirochaetia bacterium]|jgi:sucrose phosphorylase|nr:sucrose phosphorylase [Spirochaetia bacterium]